MVGEDEEKKRRTKDKSKDKKNQEMALKRLEELEGALIGGERAGKVIVELTLYTYTN